MNLINVDYKNGPEFKKEFILFLEEPGGKVSLAGIRQDDYYLFAFIFRSFGNLEGGPHCSSAGDTRKYSLLFCKPSCNNSRIFI